VCSPGPPPALGRFPVRYRPEVFAPGIISLEGRYEYILTFSPDLGECVFGLTDRFWSEFSLLYTRMAADESWIDPVPAPFAGGGDALILAFAPGGDRIFFVSSRPAGGAANIWYSDRVDTLWSDPVELPAPVNTSSTEFGLSLDGPGRALKRLVKGIRPARAG